MIHFSTKEVDFPDIDTNKVERWIKLTAAQYGKKAGKISYLFCNDEHILEINKQYLQHDYYTDIITFDYSTGNIVSGDLYISLDTVSSNASEMHLDFTDELHRVIIHGILHLCGQDDNSESDQKEMRRKENEALELLKKEII